MAELLIGCGNSRDKKLGVSPTWEKLTTLDIDPNCKPDVVHDLGSGWHLPFAENAFDEIHAYDVLEHVGQQGDWRFFLDQFSDFWRVLKPGGLFFAITPHWQSKWAWGDPGHTRIIGAEHLVYLSQAEYVKQVGKTPMTDYRHWYKADFALRFLDESNEKVAFALEAIKV